MLLNVFARELGCDILFSTPKKPLQIMQSSLNKNVNHIRNEKKIFVFTSCNKNDAGTSTVCIYYIYLKQIRRFAF